MKHRIAENVVHFSRVLRAAGLAVGPDRVLQALEVLELVGFDRRDDVHAALSAVMLDRHEQQSIFDAAFAAFWRDPKLLERMMHAMLPTVAGRAELDPARKRPRRLEDALRASTTPRHDRPPAPPADDDPIRTEALLSFSDRERLQKADFETMSAEEFRIATRLAQRLPLPLKPVIMRRRTIAARGRPDLRRTMRKMVRTPDVIRPVLTRPRRCRPPLVFLVDISGSMERYSRMLLHFAHGITRHHRRVETLVFGTRLTHVTHCLRAADPDDALARADALVEDWRGGTRIAGNLREFNRRWARRVLGGNAALVLVTDGLDRDTEGDLSAQAALLSRFAREVIWLNPLLRFDRFEPRAAGVRALIRHVDRFLPMHNIESIGDIGPALTRGARRRQERDFGIGQGRYR